MQLYTSIAVASVSKYQKIYTNWLRIVHNPFNLSLLPNTNPVFFTSNYRNFTPDKIHLFLLILSFRCPAADPFSTKSKLMHTPYTQPAAAAKPRMSWHKALLHDSVGPLSSTHLDTSKYSSVDRQGDPLAARLFSPEDSGMQGMVVVLLLGNW